MLRGCSVEAKSQRAKEANRQPFSSFFFMDPSLRYLVPHSKADRVLASVRRVHSLVLHPQADKLSLLSVSVLGRLEEACGWQVVVNHEQHAYERDDLVVYIEIDAVLPMNRPEFQFMEQHKGRVKTVRIRGELSQGLVFPLTLLPARDWSEGDDVTAELEICKFVPLEERDSYTLGGSCNVPFPSSICERTEEVRIQNTNLARWGEAARDVVLTEKLHGTSATYLFDAQGHLTHVCSRNFVKAEDQSVWWHMARQLLSTLQDEKVTEEFRQLCPLVVQGEICGPNINGNLYRLPQPTLFVFTTANWNFDRHEPTRTKRIAAVLRVPTVPEVANHVDLTDCSPRDILSRFAEGPSLLQPQTLREGVVGRSNLKHGPLFSFKALNNQLLALEKTHKLVKYKKMQQKSRKAQAAK